MQIYLFRGRIPIGPYPETPRKILLQYRNQAAVKVNAEQLLFNWQLGRDLVIRIAQQKIPQLVGEL